MCIALMNSLLYCIDKSHLSVLLTALNTVYQWFPLGIHLGLTYSTLRMIENDEMQCVEKCKISMLLEWLGCPDESKRTKQLLQNALKQILPQAQLILIPGEFRIIACV